MVQRAELDAYLSRVLDIARFRDYGPNGLQVEGKPEVRRIVSGVTASQALIDEAINAGADALLVHHGLFWRGHDGRVTGWMKKRLARLLEADLNVYAYHLPLDSHATWGNNAQLGQRLGVQADASFGEQGLGFIGSLEGATSLAALTGRVVSIAQGRAPTVVPGDGRPIRRLAWCTGGAQGYFEPAIAAGADAFVTGEISEPQAHYARESGVAFIACGHHASERFGVQALGAHLADHFGVAHTFIDVDNPA